MEINHTLFLRGAYRAEKNLGICYYDKKRDIESKRDILRRAGISSLTGRGNVSIPIKKVRDYQIGAAYENIYIEAEKHLAKNIPKVRAEDGKPLSALEKEIAEKVFIITELEGEGNDPDGYYFDKAEELQKMARA